MKKCRQRKPRFSQGNLIFRCTLYVIVFQYAAVFFIPTVNMIADQLTGFKQTSPELNWSYSLYPAHSYCKYEGSHAVWHEVSANGLVDLIYLCDYVNKVVIKYLKK